MSFSYEECVRAITVHTGKQFGESLYKTYHCWLNALNDLLENTLTCEDILAISDYYSDVLLDKHPEVALFTQDERVSGLCRLMAEDTRLSGFSLEKREILAFAIMFAHCALFVDGDGENPRMGIYKLTSLEKIMEEYALEKESSPEMFPSLNPEQPNTSEKFGYSKENPIRMTSIPKSYEYLKRLQAEEGEIVSCGRLGNVGRNHNGHIIDLYEIQVKQKGFLFFSTTKTFRIYIDAYAQTASDVAPEHFKLK